MEEEIWKDIPNYENTYQVSSFGRIKRLQGFTSRLHKGKIVNQPINEKILAMRGTVYPQVSLCKNGECKTHYNHHLVAECFLEDKPKDIPVVQICHNDGNRFNPHYKNLRYDSPTGNAKDRHTHGTHAIGESNPVSKYSEELIANVKHDLLTMRQFKVAEEWDMPKSTIRSIKQGKIWSHVEPKPEEPLFSIEL